MHDKGVPSPSSGPRAAADHRRGLRALGRHVHETALNAISDMVAVVDEGNVYRMVNDAWCRTLGRLRDDVIGRHVDEAFPEGISAERRQAVERCLRNRQAVTLRGSVPLAGLQGRTFESTYFPYGRQEDSPGWVVIVSRDVTPSVEQERAVTASTEDLRRTLDVTGDAIFASAAATADDPVLFVNDRFLQMWGIAPVFAAELTPRRITEHVWPLLLDADAEVARILEMVDVNVTREQVLTLRDGRTLLRRCTAAPRQERTMRVWSYRDISAETGAMQRLRDEEAQTRDLLEAFPGLIGVLDDELRYLFVNDSLARLIGLPREHIIGRTTEAVLGAERAAALRSIAAKALEGAPVTYEREYGEVLAQVTMSARVDRRSGKPRFYAFGIDVTAMKRAEQALVAARDEAELANRAKSQFLSHMSHELRTPLNAILGFAQLLSSDTETPLAERQRTAAMEIERGGRHLLSLINDVLDLGRIEAGKLVVDLVPLPLLPVVTDCLRLVEPLARQHGVLIKPLSGASFDRTVVGDPVRLKQVLLNLLGNAIKYNRVGGSVELTCAVRPGLLRLTVHDTGRGLTDEQLQRLFTPFERMHVANSAIEGTGIGLALSRRLVQAMGGDIDARSLAGEGSEFWIDLPRPRRQPARVPADDAAPATAPAADAPGQRTVLYIEDNPVNIVLMEAMLSRVAGLRLISATHPDAGLETARSELPDLILLDIQLPGMSGFDVLRHLRADPRTQGIPAIAVSANAMSEDVQAGLGAGFAAYLTKPLELELLVRAVEGALASDGPAD